MCRIFEVLLSLRNFSCSTFALSWGCWRCVSSCWSASTTVARCIGGFPPWSLWHSPDTVQQDVPDWIWRFCCSMFFSGLPLLLTMASLGVSLGAFGCGSGTLRFGLRNSSSIGRRSASCCRAVFGVVLKHPVIVFMARHCTDMTLFVWEIMEEFFESSGLCQIAAPYWVLGLLTYLNGVSHVILVMLDSARANLVPFLVAYSRFEWNFSFCSKVTPR